MKSTHTIELPKLIAVTDYHDFEYVKSMYRQIGLKVNIKEVGFSDGDYYGVVYSGLIKKSEIDELAKKSNLEFDI